MSELAPGAVTTADLYRELVGMRADIVKALTRVEVIDTRTTADEAMRQDHEMRIRGLEAFRWKLTGVAVLASAASGYAGYLVGHAH
jgi:hypothetical protein